MVITLAILGMAILLFITELIRMDLVGLVVMSCLALAGILSPAETLSGFSNSAVVTVWALFILSAGLSRTGVASMIGRKLLRLAGNSEGRLLLVIMLASGVASAFMSNTGVVAMFLPVMMDIARQTGRSPSRLLMPLAQATLLGGMLTLIGTSSNILVSDALALNGLKPFGIFDFTPIGISILLIGTLFTVLVGRHLLPQRNIAGVFRSGSQKDLGHVYDLEERMFVLHLLPDSLLDGKNLAQSRLRTALGLNVIGIIRHEKTQLAPEPDAILRAGDRLWVIGRMEQWNELCSWQELMIREGSQDLSGLVSSEIGLVEVSLPPRSQFLGRTIGQVDFRRRFGFNVVAILREDVPRRTHLQDIPLYPRDTLLLQATPQQIDALQASEDFIFLGRREPGPYRLYERLLEITIPQDSALIGKNLAESRLGHVFGINILGILRDDRTHLMPGAGEILRGGDTLIAEARLDDLAVLHGLQELCIDRDTVPDFQVLENENFSLVEAVLHPRTSLAGKTLCEIRFREKYGLTVLAIWSNGRAYRSDLLNRILHLGDALLLYGPRHKLRVLGEDPNFMVLSQESQQIPVFKKAPMAALIMIAVLVATILGGMPIAIAALAGAALMVLTKCLSMDDAYESIEWKAVFLIAGMLPLGIALEKSGVALLLAEGVVKMLGGLGALAVLAGLFVLANLASQFMPSQVVVVVMAPIALQTASTLGISPYAAFMLIAVGVATTFLSPVGTPAGLLVMGPGGYRSTDYLRAGLPLTILVLVVSLLLVPLLWPLY
jgi:di/tricarboxylate transporter